MIGQSQTDRSLYYQNQYCNWPKSFVWSLHYWSQYCDWLKLWHKLTEVHTTKVSSTKVYTTIGKCQIGIVPKCKMQTTVSEVSNDNTTKCGMQKAKGWRPSEHGTLAFHRAEKDLCAPDELLGHVWLMIRQNGYSTADEYAMQEPWLQNHYSHIG